MMIFRRSYFLAITLGAASAAFFSCSDDDKNNPPGPGPSDAAPFDAFRLADSAEPKGDFNAVIVMVQLKNQKKAGVPDKVFPSPAVKMTRFVPARKPDVVQPGGIDVAGLGCEGFKLDFEKPLDRHIDSDMGNVTIEGLTGADAPKPLNFIRIDTSGGMGDIRAWAYVTADLAPFPSVAPNLPLPYAPVGEFLKPGDLIQATIGGGADLAAIPKNEPVAASTITNLEVTNDLWSIKPDQVDGSKDLTIEYTCGGGPCQMGAAMTIQMISTDGELPPPGDAGDAGKDDLASYQFPFPKRHFGFINCNDLLVHHPNSFTIKKEVLAVMSGRWSRFFVQVAPVNIRGGASPKGDAITYAGGNGLFGISVNR